MHKILVLSRLEGVYLSPKDLDPVPREVMRYKFVPIAAPESPIPAPEAPEVLPNPCPEKDPPQNES